MQNFKLISQIVIEILRFEFLAKSTFFQNNVFEHFQGTSKAINMHTCIFKTILIAYFELVYNNKAKRYYETMYH